MNKLLLTSLANNSRLVRHPEIKFTKWKRNERNGKLSRAIAILQSSISCLHSSLIMSFDFSSASLLSCISFFTLIQILTNCIRRCNTKIFLSYFALHTFKGTTQRIFLSPYDSTDRYIVAWNLCVECCEPMPMSIDEEVDAFHHSWSFYFDSKPSSFTLNFALFVLLCFVFFLPCSLRFCFSPKDRNQFESSRLQISEVFLFLLLWCIRSPMYKICNFYHHWILN